MIGFYKRNMDFLVENSVLPDKRRYIIKTEGPKHFIDLDHYGNDSLSLEDWVPIYWSKAKEKYGQDTLMEYGILPWNIQWMMRKLEKAFLNKDIKLILKYSSELGHYVSDAHVPLHTTENYNGQLTNQHGIHGLWESRLVELQFENYDFFVGKAIYQENPLRTIWEVIYESHQFLPQVFELEKVATDSIGKANKFSIERRGAAIQKNYSSQFSDVYHGLMGGMVQKRMRKSVLMVGSLWFTAWVNGGQPNLDSLIVDKILMNRETKDSIRAYQNEILKLNRSHEH